MTSPRSTLETIELLAGLQADLDRLWMFRSARCGIKVCRSDIRMVLDHFEDGLWPIVSDQSLRLVGRICEDVAELETEFLIGGA